MEELLQAGNVETLQSLIIDGNVKYIRMHNSVWFIEYCYDSKIKIIPVEQIKVNQTN